MNVHQQPQQLIGKSVSGPAHAKLNLRLKIVGRRDDGFHLLSMLNHEISLADEIFLRFESEPGVRFATTQPHADKNLSDPSRNLAARAASSFLQESGAPLGISLRLQKNIPIGAGLGGGSSNAAAVLRLLHRELNFSTLPRERLFALAAALGADVPYFLEQGLCRVAGIGDDVRRIESDALAGQEVFLFVPNEPILTPALYAEYRKKFPALSNSSDIPFERKLKGPPLSYESILSLVENDFERVLPDFAPQLWLQLKSLREDRRLRVGLTGSGSAYFALAERGAQPVLREELETWARPFGTRVLNLRFVGVNPD